MRIEYLCDHSHWTATLAAWHSREWQALLPEWSEAEALAELRTHVRRCHLPTTLLAVNDGQLLGSVSLLVEDHPQLEYLSPWLASLYVIPAARQNGVGSALVKALLADAKTLGIDTLYLYTEGRQSFYERLGWKPLERTRINAHEVTIMSCRPTLTPAASPSEK
jgi:predicted N-acetyltransferase YhbS